LQKFLVSKGLLNMPAGIAYGLYGLLTRTAVESYQRTRRITPTGTAGPLTEAAVVADTGGVVAPTASASLVLTHDLHIGDTGSDVSAVQTFLVEKGFLVIPTGNVKGLFGSLTEAAIMKYQKGHHISQTGIVGPKTRAAIMAGA
jgi:peptidoglycan hydrolase-like protein with peptidoglycan-binding domain